MGHRSAVRIFVIGAILFGSLSGPAMATCTTQETCRANYYKCYFGPGCGSLSNFCPWCEDQYQLCLQAHTQSPFVDTCTSCARPASGDADSDGIPDALEYDLAHRFFPNLWLQGYDYDLSVAYPYLGYPFPYSVQPYTGDLCDEDHECLEIRYGIAYTWDFGDNNVIINTFIDHPHEGDSEFYAVLIQRTAPWASASADSQAWQLIRDFTSAHWGSLTDSSRMVSYGYCPPECSGLGATACRSHSQCGWFSGLCTGQANQFGVQCGQQPSAESCQSYGCRWLPPTCGNRGEVHCYSASPLATNNTVYASERKHGNYHSVAECNSGAWTADQCPSSAYNLRSYKEGKLQNVGGPLAANHAAFDTDMQAPDLCNRYRLWDDGAFGESTPYKKHFNFPMNWNLPAPWDTGTGSTGCGETTCVPVQGMYVSHFSGPGCTGTESYYLPYDGYAYSCRTWNGTGQCGTTHRTVTNTSYRINGSACQDAWPAGNTLADFVTVYRGGSAPANPVLSVARGGSGAGTVTSSPAGISCGTFCSASFSPGTVVTLSAAPAAGSTFVGWSGAGCSGTGSCSVSLSAAQSVSAVFDVVVATGCGEATCVAVQGMYVSHYSGPGCTGTESYYLPYDDYTFACRTWDGGGQCGTIQRTVTNYSARINGGPCQDLWPSGNTLSNFVTVYRNGGTPVSYALSVSRAGTGSGTVTSSPAGISCGAACSASFSSGTVVTLSAAASAGSTFAGWSGGGCSGTGACTVTLSAAQSVTATFNANPAGGCGEATCVPVQGMYVSHFSGPGCTGTESYYLPYDGYAYSCRTWDGTGQCGTIHRTVTNTSYRYNGGPCQDAWPGGNTLSDFVTVYRGGGSPAGGCGEASCVPVQGTYVSHFSGPGCTGTESYYLPYDGYAYACRSWNGTGQCGTVHRTVTNYSYRINGSACQDAWPGGNTLSDFVTVYR
jgi:archaellum component FlaF (FlaF/FlaG flagellin family)